MGRHSVVGPLLQGYGILKCQVEKRCVPSQVIISGVIYILIPRLKILRLGVRYQDVATSSHKTLHLNLKALCQYNIRDVHYYNI